MGSNRYWGLLSLALMGLLALGASASLFAIDLGGENLKVSVVKPGRTPISIVINEMSRRKTPALTGFINGERVMGEEAVTMMNRHPDKIFRRLRDMLGKRATDPDVAQMLRDDNLAYTLVEDPERGSIRLKLPDTGKEYSVEELMAGVLTYAHRITMDYAGQDIRDCVIVVPPFFSPPARRALLDAAELARINVFSLLHSHAAAALQHGIEQDYTNRTERVVLYDVGATAITAALVEYSAYPESRSAKAKHLSQFEVKDVAWLEHAGALQLDQVLMRHFAAQFVEKYGTANVINIPRAVAKMSKHVRRAKEMLSANHEAPLNVEELYDDKDFASRITRTEFEELAGDYWAAMKKPLAELVERNSLTADTFTLQLLGGGSRTPRTRAELLSTLPDLKLEKQLDADEAVALGAGLYAANKSTMFRLRPFGMQDGQVFPVKVVIEDTGGVPESAKKYTEAEGGQPLFPYMKKLGAKRKLTLTDVTADPLVVSLVLEGEPGTPRFPSGVDTPKLVTYKLTGLSDAMTRYKETGKVGLHFESDANGLVGLTKGEATIEYQEEVQVDQEVPDPEGQAKVDEANIELEKKDAEEDAERAKKKEEEVAAAEAQAEEDKANGKEYSEDELIKKEKKEKKKKEKEERESKQRDAKRALRKKPAMKKIKVPKTVTKTRVVVLTAAETLIHGIPPMTADQKKASMALLSSLTKQEEAKALSARTKNELESYIIAMKAEIEDSESLIKVSTEEQRADLVAKLTDAEDWLYMDDEADEAEASVYTAKLDSLRALGDAIKVRAKEAERRDERMGKAMKLVDVVDMATNSWPDTKAWLDADEVSKLVASAKEYREWLEEKTAAQAKLALHEEPAYLIEELQVRFESVNKVFQRLNAKTAPKPPPTKDGDSGDAAGGDGDAGGDAPAGDDAGADGAGAPEAPQGEGAAGDGDDAKPDAAADDAHDEL